MLVKYLKINPVRIDKRQSKFPFSFKKVQVIDFMLIYMSR